MTMRKILQNSMCLFASLISISAMGQATFQTIASGSWSTVGTWTITAGSDGDGNNLPDSNDDVTITNTYSVTYTAANVACKNLTIDAGGKLSSTSSARTVTVHGTTFSNAGTLSGSGNISFASPANGTVDISGAGSFTNTGSCSFTKGGSIAANVTMSSLLSMSLASSTYTITNNGSITIPNGTLSQGANQWTNASNSTLSVKNNITGTGVLKADASGNTVIYTSSSSTIKNPNGNTYYNLSLPSSAGSIKQLQSNTIVLGNLSIGAAVTLNANNHDLTVGGSITTSGSPPGISGLDNSTLTLDGTSGTQTISGTISNITCNHLTINNTGSGVSFQNALDLNGNLTLTAGTFTTTSSCLFSGGSSQNISGGGSLTTAGTFTINNSSGVTSTSTVDIKGDLTLESGVFTNNGTLNFNGSSAQTINGTSGTITCGSGGTIAISNSSGVTTSRPFTIDGTISATTGTFATGSTPIYLTSVAGTTGRIGDCTGGSLSGTNWFMERYIEAADSGWQDISCPINGANISSWDSTLYMSLSLSCPDGVSYLDDGSQFYSFAYWNVAGTGAWSNVIDCSEALSQARGYEMWLATDLISFDATTIRTIGTPNVGTINTTVGDAAGEFALVGNPYMSPLLWSAVLADNSNVQDYFQVYDDVNHTYALWDDSDGSGTGKLSTCNGEIPAYQGFWVENANTTSTFTFNESHKTSSTFELAKHQKLKSNTNLIRMKIYSKAMPNAHESIIKFNSNSTPYYDISGDASFLPSRDKKSPSITPLTPDDRRLVVSSYPMHEEILNIPIAVTTGVKGDYLIDFKNINSVTAYSCLVLEDVSAKKLIPLNSDFTYSFTSDDINGSKKDFILHCYNNSSSCRTTTTSPLEPIVIVNENGVNAYFNFEQSTPTSIQVYNVVGQNMLNISKEIYHDVLPMELKKSNSVYFIQITTADNTYTKKIIY